MKAIPVCAICGWADSPQPEDPWECPECGYVGDPVSDGYLAGHCPSADCDYAWVDETDYESIIEDMEWR